jgi:hypothetical protein
MIFAAAGVVSLARAASSSGDVVGKVTVGYQGWFACSGDGAPINGWWHWTQNWGQAPSPTNQGIKDWPDMREYTKSYQTGYANLGNGQPAKLFSSFDQQTVNTHFLWMHQYGIDCAALQRFNPFGGEGPTRDSMAVKVRAAAEANGVKFYIMYDVSGWTNMQTEIKTDWTNKMSKVTASAMYAKQNSKPVVCIWGFGYSDANHPFTAAQCSDVVTWFKGQGCYVIAGVPREWRTTTAFLSMFHSLDMISPWLIGALSDVNGANGIYTNYLVPDQADCNANNMDYQPCVLPGDNSLHQRAHGDLMWRMFYNAVRAGCQGIYISMFDEFNEGNQIAKTAEDLSMVPAGSSFIGLNEDGTACSSDYYLRLTGDGGKMLKGQIAQTATRPTQPTGPNRVIRNVKDISGGLASPANTVVRIVSARLSPVSFSLPVSALSVRVYDFCGRLVVNVPVVNNACVWNGTDDSGKTVSAGGYFARATGGKQSAVRPFVVEAARF